MRVREIAVGMMVVALVPAAGVWGQTHVVKKPETVVRAVAVYEWTGEAGKATASRVVPVSVFINGQLEDAGVYLARPVPFALDVGTVFEVEKAGVPQGSVELAYARHYINNYIANGAGPAGGSSAVDDGWVAYGPLKLKPAETAVAAKKSGPLPQVVASGGSRPHFSNGGSSDAGKGDGSDAKKSGDADAKKPVDRSGAAGAGTTVSAEDDPDRPTMKRRDSTGGTDSKADSGSTAAKSDSDSAKDDPDRPTLKKRVPMSKEEAKAAAKKKDLASVTGSGSLNDDPDRPVLHRGAPASATDEEHLPPLHGLPKDMKQMVAVSDARDRPEHEFARGWESDAERAEVTARLEEVARVKLAGYSVGVAATPAAAAGSAPTQAAVAGKMASSAKAPAGSVAARKARGSAAPAAAAPVALTEENVRGYTLSSGGAATYVFSASSPGVGGAVRYVSVVAQREPLGQLKVALTSVTDSKHLDRTPWMRLVDAVDAEASNRASLLFELRGETSRQFGLYRVIGGAAEQTFLTAVPE